MVTALDNAAAVPVTETKQIEFPAPGERKYKSRAQVAVTQTSTKLPHGLGEASKDFEKMLRDPTIKLAIDIVTALAMKEPWIVEGDDIAQKEFIYKQLEPYRKSILRSSLIGFMRRGWRAFETRYDFDYIVDEFGREVLHQVLTGLKALRPERTWKVIDPDTGDMLGVLHQLSDYSAYSFVDGHYTGAASSSDAVFIDSQHCLFVNQDDEGYGEYGYATMEAAHRAWIKWIKSDEGAQRYDEKVAGGFVVIKYPVGETEFAGNGGEKTDNAAIADAIGKSLEASGIAKLPIKVIDDLTGAENAKIQDVWSIEHIAPAGNLQPSFVDRAKYLDALKMRAFGLPERSATEGSLGTKAEAEAHADIALLVNHERHDRVVDAVNSQVVAPLCMANYGNEGAVRLTLGELDRASKELFTQIFTALMTDPVLGNDVSTRVDVDSLLDKLQIPIKAAGEFAVAPDIGAGAQ